MLPVTHPIRIVNVVSHSIQNGQRCFERKQLRVKIIDERETVVTDPQSAAIEDDQPPPTLDLEGYEDIAPEWGGIEEQIEVENHSTNRDAINKVARNEIQRVRRKRSISFKSREQRKDKVLRFTSLDQMNRYYSENDLHMNKRIDGLCKNSNYILSIDSDYEDNYIPPISMNNRVRDLPFPSDLYEWCRLCSVPVRIPARKTHIYKFHMGDRPIFKCPLCFASSSYHSGNIKTHIKSVHGIMLKPISAINEYKTEIDALLYSCFSDRRMMRNIDHDVIDCVSDILDWCCGDIPPSRLHLPTMNDPSLISILTNKHAIISDLKTVCEQMPDNLLEPDKDDEDILENTESTPQKMSIKSSTSNTCRVCGEINVKHLERHVLQHHVKKAVYHCPFCNYSSTYSNSPILKHIKAKHKSEEYKPPIDTRTHFQSEIHSTYNRCFE